MQRKTLIEITRKLDVRADRIPHRFKCCQVLPQGGMAESDLDRIEIPFRIQLETGAPIRAEMGTAGAP